MRYDVFEWFRGNKTWYLVRRGLTKAEADAAAASLAEWVGDLNVKVQPTTQPTDTKEN